jgi:hypothetical protein
MSSPSPVLLPTLRDLCILCVKSSARCSSLALFTRFQKQCRILYSLTSLFSVAPPRSFTLFFTLAEISPLFEHSYQKYPGVPLARHKIGTIVPMLAIYGIGESLFADVFIPDGGIFLDVIGKERDAFLRIQIDDFNTERAEPFDAALECPAFTDHDACKTELTS